MSSQNVEFCNGRISIGSPESDMEFVTDRNGKATDVIRFKPGRKPPCPGLDQELLALQSALSVELQGETNQGDEVREIARSFKDAEFQAVLF